MDLVYRAAVADAKTRLKQAGVTVREAAEATATPLQHMKNVLSGSKRSKPVLERLLHHLHEIEKGAQAA